MMDHRAAIFIGCVILCGLLWGLIAWTAWIALSG